MTPAQVAILGYAKLCEQSAVAGKTASARLWSLAAFEAADLGEYERIVRDLDDAPTAPKAGEDAASKALRAIRGARSVFNGAIAAVHPDDTGAVLRAITGAGLAIVDMDDEAEQAAVALVAP